MVSAVLRFVRHKTARMWMVFSGERVVYPLPAKAEWGCDVRAERAIVEILRDLPAGKEITDEDLLVVLRDRHGIHLKVRELRHAQERMLLRGVPIRKIEGRSGMRLCEGPEDFREMITAVRRRKDYYAQKEERIRRMAKILCSQHLDSLEQVVSLETGEPLESTVSALRACAVSKRKAAQAVERERDREQTTDALEDAISREAQKFIDSVPDFEALARGGA